MKYIYILFIGALATASAQAMDKPFMDAATIVEMVVGFGNTQTQLEYKQKFEEAGILVEPLRLRLGDKDTQLLEKAVYQFHNWACEKFDAAAVKAVVHCFTALTQRPLDWVDQNAFCGAVDDVIKKYPKADALLNSVGFGLLEWDYVSAYETFCKVDAAAYETHLVPHALQSMCEAFAKLVTDGTQKKKKKRSKKELRERRAVAELEAWRRFCEQQIAGQPSKHMVPKAVRAVVAVQ